jgi:prepilin-type N-terminal cleavage/methylation domain-containing protein
MRQKIREEEGFTLIEMLIVLFIIGIVLAIAIPNLKSAGETARERADQANRKLIGSQADNYYLEHGKYPSSVEELVKKNYIRSAPQCPGGKGKYVILSNPSLPPEKRVVCK